MSWDRPVDDHIPEQATSLKAGQEPIPGYQLVEPLGKGGFGEVWRSIAPGGLFKAIKFVTDAKGSFGEDKGLAFKELQALDLIKNIRHPFVLSVERVEVINGTLM